MRRSILEGKQILAVDGDPQVLQTLEQEILRVCPNCRFDKSTTYIQAVERMISLTYDLVVLGIKVARKLDLLSLAVMRNFPAAMLGGNPLDPDALKRFTEMGARVYLPRDRPGEFVPFLEDVLTQRYQPGWKRIFEKMKEVSVRPLAQIQKSGFTLSGRIGASRAYRSNNP